MSAGRGSLLSRCENWPTDYRQAGRIQKELADRVRICALKKTVETVGGIDVGFIGPVRRQKELIAGVVIWRIDSGEVVERQYARCPVCFGYVSGYLSFREIPGVMAALDKLRNWPDVFLADGQGLAHPRRFGLGSHIGVMIDHPTVGCAKSRLIGTPRDELGSEKGDWVELEDKGDVIGAVVRTRTGVKPVYVSVGHRVTLAESIELVLRCCGQYRLPEPARLAHRYVTELTKQSKD